MKHTFPLALLLIATAHAAEPCQTFHGRADFYSGDGQMFLWHIGTHHLFWLLDEHSQDMVFHYIPFQANTDNSTSLYADFTVCPTVPFKPGAAQFATLQRIEHPFVATVR